MCLRSIKSIIRSKSSMNLFDILYVKATKGDKRAFSVVAFSFLSL